MPKSNEHPIYKLLVIALLGIISHATGIAQPTAQFTSDTTKGCAPVTINFASQSTGNGLRYLWVFGNGNVSTLPNPQAIYYQPGNYDVSLTVVDSSGKKSSRSFSGYIQVFKNPIANFTGDPRSGCAPLSTNFANWSTPGDGQITSFIWDFGDGNTLKDSIGRHVYQAQGLLNVSLVIRDINKCQDKKLIPRYIDALPSPVPQITADKQFYCNAPLTVTFGNATAGLQSSDTYLWEFGDGTTATSFNPSHTYTKLGSYDVSLTVVKGNGCSAKKTFANYIVIDKLDLDFAANKTTGCAPAEIRFYNLTKPSWKGVTFQWDFGDGDKSYSPDNVYHTYTKSGNYDVTLNALVDNKCKATFTKSAYVRIDDSPKADFTMSDSMACKIPFTVYFTDSSKDATSIKWIIDKRASGTEALMAHTFTTFGKHKIELVAENFLQCTDTARAIFEIEKPEVTILPSTDKGCAPQTISFTRTTKTFDEVNEYYWTFENGKRQRLDDEVVDHTFNKVGTYQVKLEVTTKSGCKASDVLTINIGLKTNPGFAGGKDTLCNNESYTFGNTTNSKGVKVDSWKWILISGNDSADFSSGEDGELRTKYPPGTYGVMLISENNGCYDTIFASNKVTILAPLAKILEAGIGNCNADTLIRANGSIGEDSIQWSIYYPNGTLRESRWEQQLWFTRNYDNHQLVLTAYNRKTGCVDAVRDTLLFPKISTKAEINFSGSLCAPSMLKFNATTDQFHTYTWYSENDTFSGTEQFLEYPKPDDYSIMLKVENPLNGCRDSSVLNFTVTGPQVSGELIGIEGCVPVSIQLKCNSNPKDFTNLYWLIDTLKVPVKSAGTLNHTLLKPGSEVDGSYKIKLIGTDQNNCAGYQVFPIKVKGVLDADIKVRRVIHCSGRHFNFQAMAPGYDMSKLSINWDFGDGTTSTKEANDKFYDKDGVYKLVLKLTDAAGCVTEVSRIIDIERERLVAKLKADSLESACPPLFVQFRDLSTSATVREITNWFWDFGDGTSSIERNPSKLYLFPGKFTVKLTVIDQYKCIDSVVFKDLILVSGPMGTFDFDKKTGCAPLDVKYTGSQKDAIKTEFDMGDGHVYEDKLNFTHTYSLPGRYIPVLVLTDSFGCTYTRPPIDTIFVYDHPKPTISSLGVCFGKPITFKAINNPNDGEIIKYSWEFIQGSNVQVSEEINPIVTFNGDEDPVIRLTTTNSAGCSGTVEGNANLSHLKADFEPESRFNCVGNNIHLRSNVSSDTLVNSYKWWVGGQTFSGPNITFVADSIGPVYITLIITNALGCSDTLQTQKVVIGDSVPPLNVEILRVTVNDDETIQLDLKPSIANDFDSYEIFKEGSSGFYHLYSIGDQIKTSLIDQGNNTLKNVYCYRAELRNACGVLSDSLNSVKHCTVESRATGEINRAVIRWNSYIGWKSILGYEVLREDISNPGAFITLGATSRSDTTFIDSNIVCRAMHTYKIKAIEDAGNLQISFSDTCKAKPTWTVKPDPNELIRATVEDDRLIRIEWDSVHHPKVPIMLYVLQRSNDGEKYGLTWNFDSDRFSFEDKKVLVDDQSYFYRTFAIDKCDDTSDILNFGKTILLQADTTYDQRPLLKWSTYQGWDAGVDFYHVEIKNPDGSFSFIGETSSTDSFFVDEITNLNQRPKYCYRLTGFRNRVEGKPEVVSRSNEDCSPVYSKLYFPNAFTPNADALNERFGTPGIYIVDYHMIIYSRWGEKIFETRNIDQKWDGTYNGKPAQLDVYAVIVESVGVDRVRRVHYGTITLLR